jgi:hypothetical protein
MVRAGRNRENENAPAQAHGASSALGAGSKSVILRGSPACRGTFDHALAGAMTSGLWVKLQQE